MGNAKSHVYLIPIGFDFPELISDAIYQVSDIESNAETRRTTKGTSKKHRLNFFVPFFCFKCVSAFLYGQQVHLLAPLEFTSDLLLNDSIDLYDTILPHVEDPIKVRNYRATKNKKIQKNNGNPLSIPDTLKQMNANIVLDRLHQKLTHDWHGADNAYVIIGLTMRDLCDPQGCQERKCCFFLFFVLV